MSTGILAELEKMLLVHNSVVKPEDVARVMTKIQDAVEGEQFYCVLEAMTLLASNMVGTRPDLTKFQARKIIEITCRLVEKAAKERHALIIDAGKPN